MLDQVVDELSRATSGPVRPALEVALGLDDKQERLLSDLYPSGVPEAVVRVLARYPVLHGTNSRAQLQGDVPLLPIASQDTPLEPVLFLADDGHGVIGVEHRSTAGDATFRVFELDRGEVAEVPVSVLRRHIPSE